MTAPALAALFRAPSVPLHELVMLVRAWGLDAGLAAEWLHSEDAMVSALIDPDAGKRAHWRCAMQLARACEQVSGKAISELLAELDRPAAGTGGA
ncbi:MAG TPA: hypothetical protein PKJ45_10335 [Rubrivivax sp.]|nr:hypothetical protein [Rubrivivax sp.]